MQGMQGLAVLYDSSFEIELLISSYMMCELVIFKIMRQSNCILRSTLKFVWLEIANKHVYRCTKPKKKVVQDFLRVRKCFFTKNNVATWVRCVYA